MNRKFQHRMLSYGGKKQEYLKLDFNCKVILITEADFWSQGLQSITLDGNIKEIEKDKP
jgi:hypothetical protein